MPWHLTLSAEGRHALFPSEERRRAAVRALSRVAADRLLLFCVVDDHVHLVVQGERAAAGLLARALSRSLQPISAGGLQPAHIREVSGRSHLEGLVRYLLTQPARHGLDVRPALWSGSCFADLVGARHVAPGLGARLSEALPRYRLRAAYAAVGLPEAPLVPATDAELRAAGATALVRAAGSVLAVGPALLGKAAPVVLARRAAVILASTAGIHTEEIAWALGQPPRSVRRLAEVPVPPAVLAALRLRLALEAAAAASAAPPLVSESEVEWSAGGEE